MSSQGDGLRPEAVDKDLARKMMEHDSAVRASKALQEYYDKVGLGTALPEDRAQRETLEKFGFEPTDENLQKYRAGVIGKWREQAWQEGWDVMYVKGNHLLEPGRHNVGCGDKMPDAPLLQAEDLRQCSLAELFSAERERGRHLVVACGSAT